MRKLLTAASLFAAAAAQAGTPEYAVLDRTPGPEGSYDYVSVDADRDMLFIGREYGVMTVDLTTGKQGRLIGRDHVAAVLPIPNTDLMLTTNGGSNTATLLNRVTGAVLADIATGSDPDGAAYDKKSGLAFVMNGESKDVTVIDIAGRAAVATIPVDGVPEAAIADGRGQLFVNIEDRNEIAVIDISGRKVSRRIPISGCEEPTGLALDPVSGVLISACRNGVARFIDAKTGANRGTITIGLGADGSIFDTTRRLGYVSSIDGTLTIYRLGKDGKVEEVSTVKTAEGARTAALHAKNGQLYLPAATVEWDANGNYAGARRNFSIITVGPRP